MAEIKFIIPDDKIEKVVTAFSELYRQPPGSTVPPALWTKECLKKIIIQTVARYERMLLIQQVPYREDGEIVT